LLDSETRRRLDTARDILVGKVPDPKSQVEQITIALVYKFMDDMDKQSIEMGGKASFFKGDFKKYGWNEIFNPRLGGVEMLNLYGEAITRMSQNANLPQLFRNIFKNAFLPYRDPETLKLFLKTINEFTYDHSEKLGDAFEYLLSVLGSQGDAGQFRTPRHIIDFMVQVLGPKKNETVLDPACGTAGFLISAYKYMVQSAKESGKPLNAQDKKRIYENFTGYDISPDMVRLSLVNLYLHGFVTPNIHEYDTLTSEERWNEYADVILANPPFMSPKGGIMPHKKFSVQSNRSEVLFVDYMAEHLSPGGRAAIIVPEGIIFQSAGAYKQLRKYLIEQDYLWAVVSLPAGVFNPYAGVKTSILFLDKALAKKTDQILFVKVEADGFDLGAQRRPIDRNDLPDALNTLHAWRDYVIASHEVAKQSLASFSPTIGSALLVSISRLAENDDYNLSADRYREATRVGKQTIPLVTLGDVCERVADNIDPTQFSGEVKYIGLENIESNTGELVGNIASTYEFIKSAKTKFSIGDILYGKLRPNLNKVYLAQFAGICSTDIFVLRAKQNVEKSYLREMLRSPFFNTEVLKGLGGAQLPRVSFDYLSNLKIPLPPLEVQRQLVNEIAAHQRIIDGARQVAEGWKPDIEIDEEWDAANLGDIAELEYGFTASAEETGNARFIRITDITDDGTLNPDTAKYVTLSKDNKSYLLQEGDLLVARTGATYGKTLHFENEKQSLFASYLIRIRFNEDASVLPRYYWYFSRSNEYWRQAKILVTGGGQPQFNGNALKQISLPIPPLEVQREIVARIERERSIVEGNRELIRLYEEKVKKVIERVWEG
jgi:type I restriction enzyme M protein